MALPAELENLLNQITDPKEREAMRQTLTENHENGLRQQEFSKKMNELSTKTKEWTDWHARVDKQYKEALSDVDTLQDRIKELETARNTPDPTIDDSGLSGIEDDAIAQALKTTKAELAAALKKQGELESTIQGFQTDVKSGRYVTAEKFEEELTKRGDNLGAAIFDVIDLQNKCLQDYEKPLDRAQLIAEAQKRGGDLQGAYEALTADFKTEKLRKEIEAEFEEKYKGKIANENLPTDQNGGEPTLGPLQTRLQQLANKEGDGESTIPDEIPADGSGRLGTLAGRELREEGKY